MENKIRKKAGSVTLCETKFATGIYFAILIDLSKNSDGQRRANPYLEPESITDVEDLEGGDEAGHDGDGSSVLEVSHQVDRIQRHPTDEAEPHEGEHLEVKATNTRVQLTPDEEVVQRRSWKRNKHGVVVSVVKALLTGIMVDSLQ